MPAYIFRISRLPFAALLFPGAVNRKLTPSFERRGNFASESRPPVVCFSRGSSAGESPHCARQTGTFCNTTAARNYVSSLCLFYFTRGGGARDARARARARVRSLNLPYARRCFGKFYEITRGNACRYVRARPPREPLLVMKL